VVEHQHPAGAGNFGDETLGFRIIDAAQFVLVIEIPNRPLGCSTKARPSLSSDRCVATGRAS
jgi:hypothetical protein